MRDQNFSAYKQLKQAAPAHGRAKWLEKGLKALSFGTIAFVLASACYRAIFYDACVIVSRGTHDSEKE